MGMHRQDSLSSGRGIWGGLFLNLLVNLQDGKFLAQLRTTEEGVCCIVLNDLFS